MNLRFTGGVANAFSICLNSLIFEKKGSSNFDRLNDIFPIFNIKYKY